MTSVVSKIAEECEQRLGRAGILKPRDEALIILEKILGGKTEVDQKDKESIERAISLREQRMPIERIFGVATFCGLSIRTEKDVYKPYPETEDLVHYALSALEGGKKDIRILDLGTGTGCILLALLSALPEASGVGVDINEKALEIAKENARQNGLADRVEFKMGNWSDGINGKFDLVISNPPRAPTSFLPRLLPEMRNYDPLNSLDGGTDGLHFIKKVADDFNRLSNNKALCLCQLGPVYASDVGLLFEKTGFRDAKIMGNYSGEPCCIVVKKGYEDAPVGFRKNGFSGNLMKYLKSFFR